MSEFEIDSDWEKTFRSVSSKGNVKKMHLCPYDNCNKYFSKKARLDTHVLVHTGERPFKCSYEDCDASYSRSSHLTRHVVSAHSPNRVRCLLCPSTFYSEEARAKHVRIAHQEKDSSKRFECSDCGKTFTKKTGLHKHKSVEHEGHLLPHPCKQCGKRFAVPSKLRLHVRSRHTAHSCTQCDMAFSSFVLLRRHRAEQHPILHQCQQCGDQFRLKTKLKAHMDKHSEQREVFKCPKEGCQESYLYLRNLNDHIRVSHSGQHHQCTVADCGQSFTSRRRLARHIHSHSKPKTKEKTTGKVKKKMERKLKHNRAMASVLTNVQVDRESERALLSGRSYDLSVEEVQKEIEGNPDLKEGFERETEDEEVNGDICQRGKVNECRTTVRNTFFETLKTLDKEDQPADKID